ncbi:uncharacterized protein SCHCODRAFT_02673421 [Schizophyllum commune H4-8]|nr:uncharacterized protein SCHCODRAFT_02673421 [Schizophyllum commune H4-8]KAI5885705.1 hypothetical protein SCHCODRAFT_02673421 [Schizophyllum commune H4-8]
MASPMPRRLRPCRHDLPRAAMSSPVPPAYLRTPDKLPPQLVSHGVPSPAVRTVPSPSRARRTQPSCARRTQPQPIEANAASADRGRSLSQPREVAAFPSIVRRSKEPIASWIVPPLSERVVRDATAPISECVLRDAPPPLTGHAVPVASNMDRPVASSIACPVTSSIGCHVPSSMDCPIARYTSCISPSLNGAYLTGAQWSVSRRRSTRCG